MTKKIAVITSGGDAPGMNAAVRAIVRCSGFHKIEVFGFMRGYQGIIDNDYIILDNRSVSNLIQRGGTILRSARSKAFRTEQGRKQAAENLNSLNINNLLVIGGDGSLQGAHLFGQQWSGNIIGLPGTIDNDLYGTDATIGYYTALDTALDAIDKVRDTANAIDRVFIVEVMGRSAGFIALGVGISGGAEEILVPERQFDLSKLVADMHQAKKRGKVSFIIVLAEGAWPGGAMELAREMENQSGIECRPCVLGHIQRGGSPSAMDRILATKLGAFAVECALNNKNAVMVGVQSNQMVTTPLDQTWLHKKPLDQYLLDIHSMLNG